MQNYLVICSFKEFIVNSLIANVVHTRHDTNVACSNSLFLKKENVCYKIVPVNIS